MIKVVIVLCLITLAFSQNNDILTKLLSPIIKYKDECLTESQIEPELVEMWLADIYIPKTEESKCYFRCAYSKFNLIDKDFKVDVNALKDILPTELISVADEIVTKCDNVGSGSDCVKAYDIFKCMFYDIRDRLRS
ncbi:hypothetical protein FQR65_LT07129 [Abscondita terminalis]|nr:hypothetical protein FQR65_LT07129 [Abscondita terminalis]